MIYIIWICIHCIDIMYLDFCNVLRFLFYASILERRDGSDLSKEFHVDYRFRIVATQWGAKIS